jgi:hypothetical protein
MIINLINMMVHQWEYSPVNMLLHPNKIGVFSKHIMSAQEKININEINHEILKFSVLHF